VAETPHDEAPEFTLPDWGTAGAPQLPVGAGAGSNEPAGTLLSTAQQAAATSVLVTAVGSAESGDHERATREATAQAIDRLSHKALEMAAASVVELRLALTSRRDRVTAVAYGTAVLARRPPGDAGDR